MSNADAYRENVSEARVELERANAVVRRMRADGLILRSKNKRGEENIMVKGGNDGPADRAFSEWARCESNLTHWVRLLAEETREPTEPRAPAATVTITEEEKANRVRELAEQLAMRMGEKGDDDMAF